jgi:hypothetical protein
MNYIKEAARRALKHFKEETKTEQKPLHIGFLVLAPYTYELRSLIICLATKGSIYIKCVFDSANHLLALIGAP